MALTDEQAKVIKEQILQQVKNAPADQQERIKEYISSMNNEELEEFIEKNKLVKSPEQGKNAAKTGKECVYCLIAEKQIESYILYEDKDYIAVLEINPYSVGHTILIPKKHVSETKDLKAKAFTVADKVGKHIIKQLKAENFQITTSDEMKHAIINIIPVYKGQPLDYKRKQAQKQELQELAIKIGAIKKREKIMKIKSEKQPIKLAESKVKSTIIQLPRRIPGYYSD